jgi:hypothetical protein
MQADNTEFDRRTVHELVKTPNRRASEWTAVSSQYGLGKPIIYKSSSAPQCRKNTESKQILKEHQFLLVRTVYISAS